MTGIVVDLFKGSLYVFADGRLTGNEQGYIFSDSDDKIRKLDAHTIITNCGDSHLLDRVSDLICANKVEQEYANAIKGEGTVIIVTLENITTLDFETLGAESEKETEYKTNICTYKHSVLPLMFGSGTECLSSAYEALKIKKSKTEKEYLKAMKKAFKAAASRMSSMGPLRQTESIKLIQDKSK